MGAGNMQSVRGRPCAGYTRNNCAAPAKRRWRRALLTETSIRRAGEGLCRFTFDVKPRMGDRSGRDSGCSRRSIACQLFGKTGYVRYDPYGDKKQVALDRAE